MTRNEYLSRLRSCIQALPLDEQTEALEFYQDYFADADNDEAVMAELGTPEELAETIKAKFACVPAQTKAYGSRDEKADFNRRTSASGRAFIFDAKDIRALDLSFGAAEVVMISGDRYSVETRGMGNNDIQCEVTPYGTLAVDNQRKIPCAQFLRNGDKKNWHPRILITVPKDAKLDSVKIRVGAGSFVTKGVSITTSRICLDAGAGRLAFNGINGGLCDIHCAMGYIEASGTFTGASKIDCAMGSVKLVVNGNSADYSYDAQVGLGDVRFDRDKKSGIGSGCTVRKENHFSINCGMGAVNVMFQ
ncbi:MAG: DUF4097 family beta strand repeat protein [Spirochaetaceae bacterium]|nr:DUF4097 family beta strand repeat protein [Spirochaetaceae bacterium]MDD6485448.1 DUF4097 family beta strand repeat-containing protein [Spirochaetales bacterium]